MSEKPGTRLGAWSKRKLEAKSAAKAAREEALPQPAEPDGTDGEPEAELDLPDIETLDKDSDYTPFLDGRVPEHLQQLALRKLWSSNPVFSELDGLNDYDPATMKFLEQTGDAVSNAVDQLMRQERWGDMDSKHPSDARPAPERGDRVADAADGDAADASVDDDGEPAGVVDVAERAAVPDKA